MEIRSICFEAFFCSIYTSMQAIAARVQDKDAIFPYNYIKLLSTILSKNTFEGKKNTDIRDYRSLPAYLFLHRFL